MRHEHAKAQHATQFLNTKTQYGYSDKKFATKKVYKRDYRVFMTNSLAKFYLKAISLFRVFLKMHLILYYVFFK